MDTGRAPAVAMRKSTLTPKAIIHQKYGDKALFKVEEVQEPPQNVCPGLAIPQKGPYLYQCCLQLPEFSVVSETFKKKKDAEQSAAKIALEKLGIDPETNATDNHTAQDPWDGLTDRITYFFSDEFLSGTNPLSGHFRAALKRDCDLYGLIPASVIASCDVKVNNLCKSINPGVESNPFLVILLILHAATRLSGSLSTSKGKLWIQKQNPYPPAIIDSSVKIESQLQKDTSVQIIRIPCLLEQPVEPLTLTILSTGYYLDAIACRLGLTDASEVLLSRTIGKTSSEMRLYFPAPKSEILDANMDLIDAKEAVHFDQPINARATYISGQKIYGDAILASIGYTWRSKDLFHEDVLLQTYYRMTIRKIPSGSYKLSREAILMADLPIAFTTRAYWRGSYPRDLLYAFCRHHRLSEPVFSTIIPPLKECSGSCKKQKLSGSADKEAGFANGDGNLASEAESKKSEENFHCEIKVFSRSQDLIIQCLPRESYKKQYDSIQITCLKVLSWLNEYFMDQDMPFEKLNTLAESFDITYYNQTFFEEFVFCHSPELKFMTPAFTMLEHGVFSLKVQGPDGGTPPSSGSLSCINYAIYLVSSNEDMKELIESGDEFEFEMGTGAVIPPVEAVVAQMFVGQTASFRINLPPYELILAAAGDSEKIQSLLFSKACGLQYSLTLMRVTEPMEDRMEQALFSPPLSKQRIEYALGHIKESDATTLVDFGCGSGSLLDCLLECPTSLESIVGIDLSVKSLGRAAKGLHSKLSRSTTADMPSGGIRSAALYEGSITDFDSRFSGFDIGTCLEVIEHMEEDQACLFGKVVLSSFCPKILIVSTPNFEYNAILQKSNLPSQEEDPDDKTQSQSCKFRNHDHKFEWTREQFNSWASDLAARHNYDVGFSGVGGSADVEPGFASQIAVFRRGPHDQENDKSKNTDSAHCYKVIWEWNRCNT